MNENVGYSPKSCPVCGCNIEKVIQMPLLDGSGNSETRIVRCMCTCELKEAEDRKKKYDFEEDQRKIETLKNLSLMDAKMKEAKFASFNKTQENEKIYQIARNYVAKFDLMIERNQGILFWGDVGTGKSYTAAMIANELLNKMIPVVMTSFVKLIKEMGTFDNGDNEYIEKLNKAKLLIIDDLGTERCTDFALEKVYDVIDSRYRSKRPIILTTNITISQMKECTDVRYKRIYDRIFEMCYPVKVEGLSWRKKEAAARYADTKKILEG